MSTQNAPETIDFSKLELDGNSLFTFQQTGWRKGEPVMENEIIITVNVHKSNIDRDEVARQLHAALVQDSSRIAEAVKAREPKWVKIGEGVPADQTDIYVWIEISLDDGFRRGTYREGLYDRGQMFWEATSTTERRCSRVTHWMPRTVPEAPTGSLLNQNSTGRRSPVASGFLKRILPTIRTNSCAS